MDPTGKLIKYYGDNTIVLFRRYYSSSVQINLYPNSKNVWWAIKENWVAQKLPDMHAALHSRSNLSEP
jgi:hypothetical protein